MKANDKSYVPPGGQVKYECTERGCNKTFTTKEGLRQSYQASWGGNKTCNVCGKVFLFDSTLSKHMETHKMQISQWHHFPHNDCDSKFKSKSDLKHHTETHDVLDSGKTYPCD